MLFSLSRLTRASADVRQIAFGGASRFAQPELDDSLDAEQHGEAPLRRAIRPILEVPEPVECESAADETLSKSDQKNVNTEVLRRRVFHLALALGAFAAYSQVMKYLVDVAALDTFFRQLEDTLPPSVMLSNHYMQSLPGMVALLVSGFLPVLLTVGAALIVPACGIVGAEWNHRPMLWFFSSCNLFNSLASMVGILLGITALIVIHRLERPAVNWLQMCDPIVCSPLMYLDMDMRYSVDCIAATLPTYKKRFPAGPHLPAQCLPIGLVCRGEHHEHWMQYCHVRGTYDMGRCEFGNGKCRLNCDAEGTCDCVTRWHVEMDKGRLVDVRAPEWTGDEFLYLPDLTTTCSIDFNATDTFHALAEVAPTVAPRLYVLLGMRIILLLPVCILSAMGFVLGKQLHDGLASGYASVTAPAKAAATKEAQAVFNLESSALRLPSTSTGEASSQEALTEGRPTPKRDDLTTSWRSVLKQPKQIKTERSEAHGQMRMKLAERRAKLAADPLPREVSEELLPREQSEDFTIA
eukprot:TRINITY_DN123278_c0_g1_i1.p1 TRINITY_DN123278_c0_g1~~TRINITY_DN123278_c0_g1_i1.p1  ORF type:complete len:523 (-),score=58.79 TRINITY_DN123278_c0_g1_i1:342-1910(-)